MRGKGLFLLLLLVSLLTMGNAQEMAPVPVSPGNESDLAVVGQLCPTFSWTAVDWAAGYKIAVFETATTEVHAYEAMAAVAAPLLSREIRGRALSWTPSSVEQLQTGGLYVWYVQALDYSGQGVWSAGKVFTVDAGVWPAGMAETVRKSLREKGVADDVINDVLRDIRAGQNGGTVPEADPHGGFKTQDKIGIQGTEGGTNTFYGLGAGSSSSGICNTFIGRNAGLWNAFGNDNTFVGYYAGYNSSGSRNVFLGNSAGYDETGHDKLYIANSFLAPLIYGEFDNGIVGINGILGVGTQSPGYPLHVRQLGTNASIVLDRVDGAMNYVNATSSYGNFGTANNFPLRLVVNATWRMRLNPNNSLTMANGATCTAGGTWTNSSSRQYKENIEGLTTNEAMEALSGLEPVKFNYKVDKDEKHVGFIAEDVPDLVATKDREGLSPMDVVAVLTKVVQDQQKTIEELGKEITELKNKTK